MTPEEVVKSMSEEQRTLMMRAALEPTKYLDALLWMERQDRTQQAVDAFERLIIALDFLAIQDVRYKLPLEKVKTAQAHFRDFATLPLDKPT